MNLYEIISTSGFDDAEAERIAELLNSNDFLKSILKKYGSKAWQKHWPLYLNSLMKSAEGSKKALHRREQSIEQDVGTLNSPPDKKYQTIIMFMPREIRSTKFKGKLYRDIYVECLLAYFCEDEGLKKFLHEIIFPKNDEGYSTQVLLKALIDHIPTYGYSKKRVLEMYDFLFFDRLPKEAEQELLSIRPEDELREKISSLEKEKYDSKLKIQQLEDKLNEITNIKMEDSLSRDSKKEAIASKTIDDLKTSVNNLATEIESLKRSASFQNELKKEIKRIEGIFEKEIIDLTKSINEMKAKVIKEAVTRDESLRIEITQKYDDAISTIQKQVVNAIEENKKGLLRINEEVKLLPLSEKKSQNITREGEFIHVWVNHLSENYEINLSLEEALIYHCVFKSLSYVICPNIILSKSWVECLGFESLSRIDTAGPLWVSKLDWYGLVTHLDKHTSDYKIGFLLNYDLGLSEAYLQPVLESWFLSDKKSKQKLFLIPASSGDRLAQPDLGSIVGNTPYGEVSHFSSTVDISHLDTFPSDKFKPAVKQSQLQEWIIRSKDEGFRRILVDIPKEKEKISIPENAFKNFCDLYSNLKIYFPRMSAIEVGFDVALLPYLKSIVGPEKALGIKGYVVEMMSNE